jgi:hypothetical protein
MAAHDQSEGKAPETIRRLARPFPRGFKFHREAASDVSPLSNTIRVLCPSVVLSLETHERTLRIARHTAIKLRCIDDRCGP